MVICSNKILTRGIRLCFGLCACCLHWGSKTTTADILRWNVWGTSAARHGCMLSWITTSDWQILGTNTKAFGSSNCRRSSYQSRQFSVWLMPGTETMVSAFVYHLEERRFSSVNVLLLFIHWRYNLLRT